MLRSDRVQVAGARVAMRGWMVGVAVWGILTGAGCSTTLQAESQGGDAAPELAADAAGLKSDASVVVEPSAHDAAVADLSDAATDGATPPSTAWECVGAEGVQPESLSLLGCERDFLALAAEPTDSSLPGALTVKVIIDRVDNGHIYFQDSRSYPLHYDFASTHLSAVDDLPVITDQRSFNENYTSSQRRFYLGAVTYYEGPKQWAFELAPYDTADAAMVAEAFATVAKSTYFGEQLAYHPSGAASELVAAELPDTIPVVTTDTLYDGTDFQPLTLGRSCGKLVFHTAAELSTAYVSYQEIVVLDSVPNDISVAQGIITSEFQTPLSHVNVLSQNRGTPNMSLRGAFEDENLRALEGKWVTLEVTANTYSVVESDADDKEDCLVQPDPINITAMNLNVTELTDVEDIYDPTSDVPLKEQVSSAVPAFGGKGSHYSALSYIEEANAPKAFVIPVYYYNQFMVENGFDLRLADLLADEDFNSNPAERDAALEILRDDMEAAPINEQFMTDLLAKLEADYPGQRMRFRSSTNAEDLGDFTGAGLYDSKSGDPNDPDSPVEDAVREVWASIWYFRAFEERAYRGIDHMKVGMALLVHRSFPEEEANGVASTANPFDTSGTEPGFYVNVQVGDNSVVQPEEGNTTDQFLYYFDLDGALVFLEHSNLIPEGQTVLTLAQTHQLGVALKAIHQFFYPAYGMDNASGWYAMDVEFKFEGETGEEPQLFVKQARPYPGR